MDECNDYNAWLLEQFDQDSSGLQVLELNQIICNIPNSNKKVLD